MKFVFMSILMLGLGVFVVGCEDDDNAAPEEDVVVDGSGDSDDGSTVSYDYEINGTVDALAPQGASSTPSGNYIIRGDDGVDYDPQGSLPGEFRQVGLDVWVLANDGGGASSFGRLIDIVRIRRR